MRGPADWHQRYRQQAEWTRQARRYIADHLGFVNAGRILDVGCGTGALFPDLKHNTSGSVYGLDIQLESLLFARQHQPAPALVCADALRLPVSSGIFDFTICHFVLLWLPDPLQGLKEMMRVTQPGGYVCALAEPDYGGRIDYPPEFERLGTSQAEALRDQGADPVIGRKLLSLFSDVGLQDVQAMLIGGHWSGPPAPEDWQAEWQVLADDLDGRIPVDEFDSLRRQDIEAYQRGERLMYVPTFSAWGRKP
jgi:SAM-dependent methyltransferase